MFARLCKVFTIAVAGAVYFSQKASAQSGVHQVLNGTDVYIAYPPTDFWNKAVLFVSDIYGYNATSSQSLADDIAERGNYLVVLPDLFNGDPWRSDRNPAERAAWLEKFPPEVIDPLLEGVIRAIKDQWREIEAIGGTGYCFGGKYIFRLLSEELISVGVSAHPSRVTVDEVATVKGPVQINAAAVDPAYDTVLRRASEDALVSGGKTFEFAIFSGVNHGFAVNANESIPIQAYAKQKALDNTLAWFAAWL